MTEKKTIKASKDVSSVNGSTNFVEGKDYYLYDNSRASKNPLLYQKLLAHVKDVIAIWDPHYQLDCKRLFCEVKTNDIVVEVLTICQGNESKRDIYDFANRILTAIDKKAVPKCMVVVNALKRDRNERFAQVPNWHDRYLIVDDEVYLVGTSMDAQAANSSTFGIKRLTETKDKNIVIDTYVSYRDKIMDASAPNSNGFKCTVKRGYV